MKRQLEDLNDAQIFRYYCKGGQPYTRLERFFRWVLRIR